MSAFFTLPREIRDSVYAHVVPTRNVLVLPSSTSRLVPCPGSFLVCRRFYYEARNIFYRKSSVAFAPNRSSLAELSRRSVRSSISDITILLSYWTRYRDFEVRDLSDELMARIVKLFKHLTDIDLHFLMHELRGISAASKPAFFYPSFLKNPSFNFMITKASVYLDIRSTLRSDNSLHHKDTRSPLAHLRRLPCLTELDLRIRTSKSSHSIRRSIGGNDAYTSSPEHRTLESVLHAKEIFELRNYLSGLVSLFPKVKVFRLWRAIEHRNHVNFEPIYYEEVRDLFNGRAAKPER